MTRIRKVGLMSVLVLVALAASSCGKTPTAPERVCWRNTRSGPILNAAGDSVAFTIYSTMECSKAPE